MKVHQIIHNFLELSKLHCLQKLSKIWSSLFSKQLAPYSMTPQSLMSASGLHETTSTQRGRALVHTDHTGPAADLRLSQSPGSPQWEDDPRLHGTLYQRALPTNPKWFQNGHTLRMIKRIFVWGTKVKRSALCFGKSLWHSKRFYMEPTSQASKMKTPVLSPTDCFRAPKLPRRCALFEEAAWWQQLRWVRPNAGTPLQLPKYTSGYMGICVGKVRGYNQHRPMVLP